MKIEINGKISELNPNSSLKEIIDSNLVSKNGVAVAINQQVVPRAKWSDTIVKENDKILFITATQGG
jgi:sulfur carrier protein